MATTDARTGFRLPWSTDQRSQTDETHDGESGEATATEPLEAPVEAVVEPHTGDAPEGTVSMAETTQTASEASADTPVEAPVAVPAPAAAKRPNKFLADLTRAMQAAAESAREEAVTRLQADAKTHVEAIHERSASEAADLRRRADDDVAAVREWSKAEIARIREETDQRISARKGNLEFEIEEHAARIERQIEHVQGRVAAFEREMAAFFERLLGEEDPTRFAALAENLPEPPPFDLDELAATAWLDSAAASTAEAADATAEATDTGVAAESSADLAPADAEAAMAAIEASAEAAGWDDLATAEAAAVAEPVEATEAVEATEPVETTESDPRLEALGIAPDFAAAEAAAYEAADATDAAEEIPTIADDALAARLAGLVGAEDGAAAAPTGTTQVVVTGLVSVASIASFKRHLGRLAGVQSVGVSSGPEGEFVFAVTHAPEVVLRDSVPTLPGFGARVTGGSETTVEVTAHDPESES